MADKDEMKEVIKIVPKTDKKDSQKVGKEIAQGVMEGIGNNGYIKLKLNKKDLQYPAQTKTKSGLTKGYDYSELQKAQDKLVSSWKKLSKQGFSSSDEDVLEVLKDYRKYQGAVSSHYKKLNYGNNALNAEMSDKRVSEIREVIGSQLHKYFTRVLGNVPIGEGKTGSLFSIRNDSSFEEYAKKALQKYRVATDAGIDLSKRKLNRRRQK